MTPVYRRDVTYVSSPKLFFYVEVLWLQPNRTNHLQSNVKFSSKIKGMNTEESMTGFERPLSFGYDPAPLQLMNWKDWVSKNENAKQN